MKKNNLPIVIVGTEGSSKEVYYLIKNINSSKNELSYDVIGFVERSNERIGEYIFDSQKIVASDETFAGFIKEYDKIGVIIPLSDPKLKEKLYFQYEAYKQVIFPNLIHPSVLIEGNFQMGMGNIISAGTVLACDLKVENFNLINRCCTLGHDVIAGNFNTMNPGCIISGNVSIKDRCLLGAGSIVLQGIEVGNDVILGAGGVLTKAAKDGDILVGVPAVPMKKDR